MDLTLGPFRSAKYLNFGGDSCDIRISSRSIQETYTLENKFQNFQGNPMVYISWYKSKNKVFYRNIISETLEHLFVPQTSIAYKTAFQFALKIRKK